MNIKTNITTATIATADQNPSVDSDSEITTFLDDLKEDG